MLASQTLDIDGKIFYAYPDGHLADRGWICLGEFDNHGKPGYKVCDHHDKDCNCGWYHFERLREENGRLKGGATVAEEGKIAEKMIGESNTTYAFDENGKMLFREWNPETHHYFMSVGNKATNKWLPINGYWYKFNANGDVTEYAQIPGQSGTLAAGMDKVASSSNAPRSTVASIAPVENNVSVEVGGTVTVQFKVEMKSGSSVASGSNAQRTDLTNDHDIWFKLSDSGKTSNGSVKEGNIYEVTYEAGKKDGREDVYLWIDGIRSAPLTINKTLTQANEDGEIKKGDVEDAVNNIFANPDEDVQGAVESLKSLYTADDEVKAEVQNQLLSDAASNNSSLEKIEQNYIVENKILVDEPSVSEDVQEQHGDMQVGITGAGLNASEGQTVQLQVDLPQEDWEVEGTYRDMVAFDLKLLVDQEEKKELDIPVVISIKAPNGFTNRDKLINLHEGEEINVKFSVRNSKVYFVTDRFSTYVFAITDKTATTTNPGSSSGSGGKNDVYSELNTGYTSNSHMGNWIKDANGWWIRLNDGTYPINTWKYLDFNGDYQWYHFDSMGYMRTGWFTDTDGHRYYLNPISDGTQGAMATGWKLIDGFWYYFNTVSDGTRGALLVNTTTPDGYVVNENGQRVQ